MGLKAVANFAESGGGPGSFTTLTVSGNSSLNTVSASGVITSTVTTGTAPFSIASTTVVPNLNVSQLLGATWAVPGTIGSTTPNTGAFTTLSSSGLSTLSSLTVTGLSTFSGEDGITAFPTGGKASATPLSATKNLHRVSVCATANDSILMPAALAGQAHYVRNDGAAAMQVFGAGTDTINGVATGTGISQATGMGVWYVCTTAGNWTTGPATTITATVQVLGPVGALATPTFSFTGDLTTGLYRPGSGQVAVVSAGTAVAAFTGGVTNGLMLKSDHPLGWSSGSPVVSGADVRLIRAAPAILAQQNGDTAQEIRIYGATTGAKYVSVKHDGTNAVLSASSGYFGVTTAAVFGASDPGGSDQVRINGALTINSATMIQTKTAFTNGAAALTGTLLNSPVTGNPTKWIPVNDNGTTRYIPAW